MKGKEKLKVRSTVKLIKQQYHKGIIAVDEAFLKMSQVVTMIVGIDNLSNDQKKMFESITSDNYEAEARALAEVHSAMSRLLINQKVLLNHLDVLVDNITE